MSFLDTVKSWFNVGGVKLVLMVPPSFEEASQTIKGTIKLSSKSDKHINKIVVQLEETFSQGRGESQTQRDYIWGEKEISGPMDIKTGEEKTLEFSLPFTPVKSNNEKMADQNGVIGVIGKTAVFVDGMKSTFRVKAFADVQGTAFGPVDSKEVRKA